MGSEEDLRPRSDPLEESRDANNKLLLVKSLVATETGVLAPFCWLLSRDFLASSASLLNLAILEARSLPALLLATRDRFERCDDIGDDVARS